MGSTESIPIERKHRSNLSLSTPPCYSDMALPRLECDNTKYHLEQRNASDDSSPHLDKKYDSSVSICIANNNACGVDNDTTQQRKKVRLLRKTASRSSMLNEFLSDIDNYKMTIELFSSDSYTNQSSTETRKLLSSKRFIDASGSKQKRKSLLMTSNDEIISIGMDGNESNAKKLKISNKSNKIKVKQGGKSSVFNHVLFMSEQRALEENDTEGSFEITNAGDKMETFDAIDPDREGPPRTVDQNSDLVKSPHIHDVLLGRGNGVAQFPGNQVFRSFCWNARESYHKAMRNAKGRVAERIIDLVKKRKPSGRFLEMQSDGYYTEVPFDRVKEKICQALREKKWIPYAKTAKADGFSFEIDCFHEPESPVKKKKDERVLGRKLDEDSACNAQASSCATTPRAISKEEKHQNKELLGKEIKRVAVYWPLDDRYYKATILNRFENLCYLKYDDDEVEWLDLSKHKFKVISSSKPPLPMARKLKTSKSSRFPKV